MKLLQINSIVNSGSTGRIAEDIGKVLHESGHKSYIAFGRGNQKSKSDLIRVGNTKDIYFHVLKTRLFDQHGLGSTKATQNFTKEIEAIKPDIISIHNLHGYYINYQLLLRFLKSKQFPVVWTLHDAWAFTGHCTFFDSVNCKKWQEECFSCPKTNYYPESWFLDRSRKNFQKKKHAFTGLNNMVFITPSAWLKEKVARSFLSGYPVKVIHNGIDLYQFKPLDNEVVNDIRQRLYYPDKPVLLGVASIWDKRKGLDDFINLVKFTSNKYNIVLVGLNKEQIKKLPPQILGVERTENLMELTMWYNLANVFINPTYQDNFPTTNIEALACGTPVITYNTGGSPEAIDNNTGLIVEKGDILGLYKAVVNICSKGKEFFSHFCRDRAVKHFNKDDRFMDYLKIYESLLEKETNVS